uniref:Amidohydrolase family protein n=1 Tax=Bosea sp. NBC_00436 TaxID=2969620 RepID=A0A9E7ZTN5_9HYPH
MTETLILSNIRVLDVEAGSLGGNAHIRIDDGRIAEISASPIASENVRTIDLNGMTLMPGLIDCHVHVVTSTVSFGGNNAFPDSLVAARAARLMRDMLMRGFTTVRDLGGADCGLVAAIEEGSMIGPRLVICGKALSQTGGHGDFRGAFDERSAGSHEYRLGSVGRVVDGEREIRLAAREQIKAGAKFIKIMANGGIASPTDPIHFFGFSEAELRAVVEEAGMANTYVAGHLYTDAAIRRFIKAGGLCVEHGNLVTPETADLMKEQGAFVVPTLSTFEANSEEGAKLGLPAVSLAKIETVRSAGLASLEIYRNAGVKMAYGTDLCGPMHRHQSREFLIRSQVMPAADIIRSATTIGAELVGLAGEIGSVEVGTLADVIAVNGDPLTDISLLSGQGENIPFVMKGGVILKHEGNAVMN